MGAPLLAVLVASVLFAALARRYDISAPLGLVVVGLIGGLIPGVHGIELQPDLVMFVVLPPLLWSAGLDSSYIALRKNVRSVGMLAVGLPLATTFVVGIVAFHTVPALTLPAALTLGAIVAPPDAVSAAAIGRRLGLPRQIMTLLGGESLLNDATALTAYKVSLAAALGTATTWNGAFGTFFLAAAGGVLVGGLIGLLIDYVRTWLDDPLVESAIGLVAPFVIYLVAEEFDVSGVIAVVTAALILGQRSTRATYATRLQDEAVWKGMTLVLESFAFLLIGLQLPTVVHELVGIRAKVLTIASISVLLTVILVRIIWVYAMAYLPRLLRPRSADRGADPTASQVFIVAWAGMRGVVSLAAAFGVPLTTLSGEAFPGRPQLVFMTFVVVVGTLLLHGLTLPWFIKVLDVNSEAETHRDALDEAAATTRAAQAASDRLDELLAEESDSSAQERVGHVLRYWIDHRRNAAWEQLGRSEEEIGESPATATRRLRLELVAAERAALIAERDAGQLDDEVLRTLLHRLDLLEATLDRE